MPTNPNPDPAIPKPATPGQICVHSNLTLRTHLILQNSQEISRCLQLPGDSASCSHGFGTSLKNPCRARWNPRSRESGECEKLAPAWAPRNFCQISPKSSGQQNSLVLHFWPCKAWNDFIPSAGLCIRPRKSRPPHRPRFQTF